MVVGADWTQRGGDLPVRSTLLTLALKYVVIAALSAAILPTVGRVSWLQALLPAAVVALATYLADRLVLPALGNGGTVVVDFLLAMALYWLAPAYTPGIRLGVGATLPAAGAVAIAEIVYHQYLVQLGVGVR